MAYSAKADVIKAMPKTRLAELTDDVNGTNIDDDIIDRAIADADALINSYLRGKHTVPLATTPDSIRRASIDLTVYYLYKRRIDLEVPDVVLENKRDLIKWLQGIQAGSVVIDDTGSTANTAGYYKTNKTLDDRFLLAKSDGTAKLDQFVQ